MIDQLAEGEVRNREARVQMSFLQKIVSDETEYFGDQLSALVTKVAPRLLQRVHKALRSG